MAYSINDPAIQGGNPFADEDFLMSQPVVPAASDTSAFGGIADAFGFGSSSNTPGGAVLPDWGEPFTIGSFDPADYPIFQVFSGTAGATQTPVQTTADQSGSGLLEQIGSNATNYLSQALQFLGTAAQSAPAPQNVSYEQDTGPKIFGLNLSTVLLIGGALGAGYLVVSK